jgi:putative FmdB family regulatory protein
MPFYEYQCKSCGHALEAMEKVSDAPLKKCPECGKAQLQRLMSAPVFRLKGGGWYETDFKGDQDNKRNLADRPEAEAAKDGGKEGAPEAAKDGAEAKATDAKGSDAAATKEKAAPEKDKAADKPADKPADKSDKTAASPAKKPAVAHSTAKSSARGRAAPHRPAAKRTLRKPAAKVKGRR